MYRHIKYLARPSAKYPSWVEVIIIEQTHLCNEFTKDGPYFKMGKYCLCSASHPALSIQDHCFYVQGISKHSNSTTVHMPVYLYKEFKYLVETYNEFHKR